jgi:NitT/TauT family transport system substrate-binding protein
MKRMILGALLAACVGGLPATVLSDDDVTIVMGYIPNVQFAPYYVAEKLGYFREEGIRVTFDYGYATDIMTLVARGDVEFGVSDGDQVVIARDKAIPVKVIYTMYVKNPVGIATLREKGISTIEALRGRKIGVPAPFGSSFIGMQVLLKSGGLSLDDVEVVNIGYTQIESLLGDRVDAAVVFINNEPIVLRSMGRKVDLFEAYRVTPMVSATVIAGERLITRRPDLVRGFVRAVSRASRYALENSESVMDIIRPYIPTLTEENMDINRQVLMASMKLWVDPDSRGERIGLTTRDDWEKTIEEMQSLGLVGEVKAEDCFTNEFIR